MRRLKEAQAKSASGSCAARGEEIPSWLQSRGRGETKGESVKFSLRAAPRRSTVFGALPAPWHGSARQSAALPETFCAEIIWNPTNFDRCKTHPGALHSCHRQIGKCLLLCFRGQETERDTRAQQQKRRRQSSALGLFWSGSSSLALPSTTSACLYGKVYQAIDAQRRLHQVEDELHVVSQGEMIGGS